MPVHGVIYFILYVISLWRSGGVTFPLHVEKCFTLVKNQTNKCGRKQNILLDKNDETGSVLVNAL